MRNYDFRQYSKGMTALGYPIRLAYNSRGIIQGYYISARSGREYKASKVDRRLTLGRLVSLHQYLHQNMQSKAKSYPGVRYSMPAPSLATKTDIAKSLQVLNAGVQLSYTVAPLSRQNEVGNNRSGKRWDEMTNEERELNSKGYSM